MSKIAVILVHYNDTRFLINWMEKMRVQNPDEIILVDDNSTEMHIEGIKALLPVGVQVVKNDFGKGPFSAFAKGCSVTECEFVTCWSTDDEPEVGYMRQIRYAIDRFPWVGLITTNAKVLKEGKVYKRTLFPFDSYITPDYAVKIFKAGLAKNINLIGNVVRTSTIHEAWQNGGSKLKANFDGMYFFFEVFAGGFLNLADHLVLYRSYSNGVGAASNKKDLRLAHQVHKEYYKRRILAYKRAVSSGIWSLKTQWTAWIAQWCAKYMPKIFREIMYKKIYQYDWRIEKL